MKTLMWFSTLVVFSAVSLASQEYLVKVRDAHNELSVLSKFGSVEVVSREGRLMKLTVREGLDISAIASLDQIEFIEPNTKITLAPNPSIESQREQLWKEWEKVAQKSNQMKNVAISDNPEIQAPPSQSSGADPMMSKAWGLANINASVAFEKGPAGEGIVVAVTDTGVDYNHEDLIGNMWRNSKEIAGDGVDNDNNGYVDDVVGWDFFANDDKPYDLSKSLIEILFQGGNPGHGTHCAGVVGARRNNLLGAAGVSPKVQIMAIRMIGENGEGDLAGGVKAIDYAVENGAKVISASWGSMGEEEGSEALREAIQRANDKGVLLVAAAGNGRANPSTGTSAGYDNDTDDKPVYPASYDYPNIISVAAMDVNNAMGVFSNWGKVSVDLGAPGVKVLSTVPGNQYQDTIVDLGSIQVTWDGTSMATPHVSGAVAAVWSKNPNLTAQEVKQLILSNVTATSALASKSVTGGRLNLSGLF